MDRLYIALSIALVVLLGGCKPRQASDRRPKGPAQVSMAEHISVAHGVHLGEKNADIIVYETNALVYVEFSQDLLDRVESDCLIVLRFRESKKTFSRSGYLQFLDQLHAYLVLTPIQSRSSSAD